MLRINWEAQPRDKFPYGNSSGGIKALKFGVALFGVRPPVRGRTPLWGMPSLVLRGTSIPVINPRAS